MFIELAFSGDDDSDEDDDDAFVFKLAAQPLLKNANSCSGDETKLVFSEATFCSVDVAALLAELFALLRTISDLGRELMPIAGEFGTEEAGELLEDP